MREMTTTNLETSLFCLPCTPRSDAFVAPAAVRSPLQQQRSSRPNVVMAATTEKPATSKEAQAVPGGVMTLSRYMLDQARINTDYQVCCWVVVVVAGVVVNSLVFLGCMWVEWEPSVCCCAVASRAQFVFPMTCFARSAADNNGDPPPSWLATAVLSTFIGPHAVMARGAQHRRSAVCTEHVLLGLSSVAAEHKLAPWWQYDVSTAVIARGREERRVCPLLESSKRLFLK